MTTNRIIPTKRVKPIRLGVLGKCPCCGKPTEVRLGGTHGPPATEWIVPEDVLRTLYSAVLERIKGSGDKLYVRDPHPHRHKTRNRLYFVDGGDGIAGPFGPEGLESFLHDTSPDGTASIDVYAVITTPRALRRILKSPYAVRHVSLPAGISALMPPVGPVDDPTDLF